MFWMVNSISSSNIHQLLNIKCVTLKKTYKPAIQLSANTIYGGEQYSVVQYIVVCFISNRVLL